MIALLVLLAALTALQLLEMRRARRATDGAGQAKVRECIDAETACSLDGCPDPAPDGAFCAAHQPEAVRVAMSAIRDPTPDTLAQPPRSWPPGTGTPEDVS